MKRCALCGRAVPTTTRHHLIPRTRHRNRRNKRDFPRHHVRRTVELCRPCHKQIHTLLSEKELERKYATLERLRKHAEIAKFLSWIADKPPGFRVPHRRAIARRR